MTKVVVNWGKEKLDVVCHADKTVKDFMLMLEKQTGVPIARQKLTLRRKILKPEDNFNGIPIEEGTKFMLIGTAEKPPEPFDPPDSDSGPAPGEEVEEGGMSSAERKKIYQGLPNYRNNCYLNAALQSLRALPKAESIIETAVVQQKTPEDVIEQTISNLFKNSDEDQVSTFFNQVYAALGNANKDLFLATDEKGIPMQQDASEALFFILNCLNKSLGDPFKRLFEIDIHYEKKCRENGKEDEGDESTFSIPIYVNQDTRQIEQGINIDQDDVRIDEQTKQELHWHVHRTITTLPQYIIFHIQRFEFKKDTNSTAKILRRIIHPFRIDMLPWVHPDLRKQIAADREEGKSNSGFYSLKVVLTHKGRSASQGHYVTHCKYGDTWIRFDDTKVKDIEEQDIEALSGSADWHSSLILFYEKIANE